MTEAEAVNSVKNLIKYYARRWRCYVVRGRLSYEDITQSGIAGALRAYQKFDPAINGHFPTYASYWIRSYMADECLNRGRTVHHPIRQLLRRQEAGFELPPLNCADISQLEEVLPAPEASVRDAETAERLSHALGSLPWRERKVLKLRFSEDELSFGEIGKRIGGVSRERARQICEEALRKLRVSSPDLKELL